MFVLYGEDVVLCQEMQFNDIEIQSFVSELKYHL